MEKKIRRILSSLFILHGFISTAQTGGAIDGAFGGGAISPDGKYVSAVIDKTVERTKPVLVIQSTQDTWKKEAPDAKLGIFSEDSKYYYYQLKDTLYILNLSNHEQQVFAEVSSWKLSKNNVACLLKNKNLLLLNENDSRQTSYQDINSYSFNAKGTVLLLQSQSGSDNNLDWIDIVKNQKKTIWSGEKNVVDFDFDTAGQKLAFIVSNNDPDYSKIRTSIWFYQFGADKAKMLIENGNKFLKGHNVFKGKSIGFNPPKTIKLSPGGRQVLFYYTEEPFSLAKRPSTSLTYLDLRNKELDWQRIDNVDVWSYLDARVTPDKLIMASQARRYACVINTLTSQIIQIEQDNKELVVGGFMAKPIAPQLTDDYVLIYRFPAEFFNYSYYLDYNINAPITTRKPMQYFGGYSMYEFDWNKTLSPDVYLISLADGLRKLVKKDNRPNSLSLPYYEFSPDGKYIVYYDFVQGELLSYDIGTGQRNHISIGAKTNIVIGKGYESEVTGANDLNKCKWLLKETNYYLLTTDIYGDIWQFDVRGLAQPVNLTNGFSKKLSLHLRTTAFDGGSKIFESTDKILLQTDRHSFAFSGYYSKALSGKNDPVCLVKESSPYQYTDFWYSEVAHSFLVKRHNNTTPPDFSITSDFKKFRSITSSEQEKRRCVNKELLTWKGFDGNFVQGVLFKPKDFDSTKKYPVVVTYYGWGDARGGWQSPKFIEDEWVADGYLLFVPAINFQLGELGPSVYNSVVPGVQLLAHKSYVNAKKIGILGSSFGGFETNYLVTHTNIFAAVIADCGVSNMFQEYLEFPASPRNPSSSSVFGQHSTGATPWQRPDLFLKNSPVLYADRVTSPLLMEYSANDNNIQYTHGVAMYIALRRLGKPSWLLLGGTGHGNLNFEWGQFYAKQFFDYYLKDSAAPRWMVEEIPAREQGMAKWRELDSTGRKPPVGGVRYENETVLPEQEPLLKHKTRVTNDGRIEDVVDDKKKVKKNK